MKLFLFAFLLVLASFGPLARAACQPHAVPVHPLKAPINLGYHDWLSSRLNNHMLKILIEERFGNACNLVRITEKDVFQAMEDNDVDTVFEFWSTDRPEYAEELLKPIFAHTVPAGFSGREGWYIPDYMLDFNPDFASWTALRVLDNVRILRDDFEGNLTTEKNILQKIDEQSELISTFTNETTPEEFSAAVNQLNNMVKSIQADFNSTMNHSLFGDLYTPDPLEGWNTPDEWIISQLNLPLKPKYYPVGAEDEIVNMVLELYPQRKPFLTYLYTPMQIFDPRSGVNLVRVTLFDYPPECYSDPSLLQCVYPHDNIKSTISTSLAEKSAVVDNFLSKFRLSSVVDVNEMMASYKFFNMTEEEAACAWILKNQEHIAQFYPPLQEVIFISYDSGVGIALSIIAGVLIAISIAIAVFFNINRQNPVVMASSLRFCNAIILGSLLGYVGMFMFLGEPTAFLCVMQPLLLVLSFSLIYTHILTKNFRVWRIFTKPFASSNKYLKDKNLFVASTVAMAIQIILVIVWMTIDFPGPSQIENEISIVLECRSSNMRFWKAMAWSLFIANCVLVFVGMFLAVETRRVNSRFRESRYIGIATYNIVVLAVLFMPFIIVQGMTTAMGQKILLCVLILAVPSSTTLTLFIPKIIYIFRPDWAPSHDSSGEWSASNKKMSLPKKFGNNNNNSNSNKSEPQPTETVLTQPGDVGMKDIAAGESDLIDEALATIQTGNYGQGY